MPDFSLDALPLTGIGQRLDSYLAGHLPNLTRSQIKHLIEEKRVLVNEMPCKGSYRLKSGDRIRGSYPEEKPFRLEPEDIPLDIIFRDDSIVVINKPSGMVVHPGTGAAAHTLANGLIHHFPEIARIGPAERPGIVHRLDKDTSGLLVVALTQESFSGLKRQFKVREVEKMYLALVWGRMPGGEGLLDRPIGRHPKHGDRMSIKTRHPREAKTLYEVEREFGDFSLLKLKPITGRTHQIRVHLAASGHPVVGDSFYGGRRKKRGCPRLFLHALHLDFNHPKTGVRVHFSAPIPSELQTFLDALRVHP